MLKSSIHSLTIALRKETGGPIPFLILGRTNLTLQFRQTKETSEQQPTIFAFTVVVVVILSVSSVLLSRLCHFSHSLSWKLHEAVVISVSSFHPSFQLTPTRIIRSQHATILSHKSISSSVSSLAKRYTQVNRTRQTDGCSFCPSNLAKNNSNSQCSRFSPSLQYGSRGLGALTKRMGREEKRLVKQYVMPVAKEFENNLYRHFCPKPQT